MPEQNHEIPLEMAVEMTSRYRSNMENILATEYRDEGILAVCETFDIDVLKTLQDVPGAASFRIYYGMSDDLKVHAILVAVNAEGQDILPAENSLNDDPTGTIFEEGLRCPTLCPPPSPLNGD